MTPIAGETAAQVVVAASLHAVRLVEGTAVMTLEGILPVEYLMAGDRIVTRTGARRLTGVTGTVVRDVDLVRIGPGTLAHDRPAGPVMMPADQPVLLRDWRARALYGVSQVVVPVSRLADGTLIARVTVPQALVFTLTFETPVILLAEGLEPASLPVASPVTPAAV